MERDWNAAAQHWDAESLVIAEVRAAGVATLSGIAKALTARGVPTPSGRGAWSSATVMRLDRRVQAA